MKNKKIIGVICLILLVAVMAVTYVSFSEKGVFGNKHIKIQVVSEHGIINNYSVDTNEKYLLGAMEETPGLQFEGEDGMYGFVVNSVNNVKADLNSGQAYWAFYVNGEYCSYGVSEQPINDGDTFRIVYTPAG